MKLKHMLFTAGILLLAACSKEEFTDGTPDRNGAANEVRLIFGGGGESTEYTRAIASDSENRIDRLDIYVFAAANNSADYYYLEKWESAPTDDKATFKFKLSGAGTDRKASIFPTELKGVPNLKLYCVANCKVLYTADGNPAAAFTAITTDAGTGAITNGGAATKSTAFEALYAPLMDAAGQAMYTPLVMTGEGTTKILGNIATVKVELKRRAARFDIDNDATKTGLTIEDITIGDARKHSTIMPSALAAIQAADKADKQIKYPVIAGSFQLLPKANQGMTESALYTYPLSKDDGAFLIIKGKYQNPMQQNPVPVEYHLNIQKANAMGVAENMDVNANTRYTLRIKEVMEATITAFFDIEDWTSGGGVIIKPDNAAPVLTALNVEGTAITDLKNLTDISVDAAAGDKMITLTATASGQVEPVFASTAAGWDIDWLAYNATAYDVATNTDGVEYEVKDGVPTTTMRFTYPTLVAGTPFAPVKVTLRNSSASQDESVYTTLTILPPAAVPVADFAMPYFATGNYNRYDQANKKLLVYKASRSSITLGASCPFGTTLAHTLTWLEVDKATTGPVPANGTLPNVQVSTPVGEYYTLTLKDLTTTDNSGNVTIKNMQDDTQELALTLELKDPAITALAVAAGTMTAPTYNNDLAAPKITGVSRTGNETFTLTVTSPEGVTANTLASWYDVAETTPFNRADPADATGTQVFTITIKTGVTDFTSAPVILKNQIRGVSDLTVQVVATTAIP